MHRTPLSIAGIVAVTAVTTALAVQLTAQVLNPTPLSRLMTCADLTPKDGTLSAKEMRTALTKQVIAVAAKQGGCDMDGSTGIVDKADTTLMVKTMREILAVPPSSTPPPVPVAAVCGNGQPNNEQCDDGNTISGDGCSSSCVTEPNVNCQGWPSRCVALAPVPSACSEIAYVEDDILRREPYFYNDNSQVLRRVGEVQNKVIYMTTYSLERAEREPVPEPSLYVYDKASHKFLGSYLLAYDKSTATPGYDSKVERRKVIAAADTSYPYSHGSFWYVSNALTTNDSQLIIVLAQGGSTGGGALPQMYYREPKAMIVTINVQSAVPTFTVARIPAPLVGDMVYDSTRNVLYAALLRSSRPDNNLVTIDVGTLQILRSARLPVRYDDSRHLFVKLGLTSDHSALLVYGDTPMQYIGSPTKPRLVSVSLPELVSSDADLLDPSLFSLGTIADQALFDTQQSLLHMLKWSIISNVSVLHKVTYDFNTKSVMSTEKVPRSYQLAQPLTQDLNKNICRL